MKTNNNLRPILSAILALVLIASLASFSKPNPKPSENAPIGNLPNGASFYHMGMDAKYTYYVFVPSAGDWSFEKIELSKAKEAGWVK